MSSKSHHIILDHLSWRTLDALHNIKITEKCWQHIAAIFLFTRLSAKTNSTKVTLFVSFVTPQSNVVETQQT